MWFALSHAVKRSERLPCPWASRALQPPCLEGLLARNGLKSRIKSFLLLGPQIQLEHDVVRGLDLFSLPPKRQSQGYLERESSVSPCNHFPRLCLSTDWQRTKLNRL